MLVGAVGHSYYHKRVLLLGSRHINNAYTDDIDTESIDGKSGYGYDLNGSNRTGYNAMEVAATGARTTTSISINTSRQHTYTSIPDQTY
jgi:hypothetical protein